jgi:hypothetical protein
MNFKDDDSCCGVSARGVTTFLLAILALAFLAMLPELRRYFRIRAM